MSCAKSRVYIYWTICRYRTNAVEQSRELERENRKIDRSTSNIERRPYLSLVTNRCTIRGQRCIRTVLLIESFLHRKKKMARIVAVKEYLEKALKDENKPWVKMFAFAEQKIGVDRLYIFVGELLHEEQLRTPGFPVISIDWRPAYTAYI